MNRIKTMLAVAGFLLAGLSVAYDERLFAWAAMVLLAGSLGLRLWLQRRDRSNRGPETPM
jgi:hypothetical protein